MTAHRLFMECHFQLHKELFRSLGRIRSCAHVCAVECKKARIFSPCGGSWSVKYGASTTRHFFLNMSVLFPGKKMDNLCHYGYYGWLAMILWRLAKSCSTRRLDGWNPINEIKHLSTGDSDFFHSRRSKTRWLLGGDCDGNPGSLIHWTVFWWQFGFWTLSEKSPPFVGWQYDFCRPTLPKQWLI